MCLFTYLFKGYISINEEHVIVENLKHYPGGTEEIHEKSRSEENFLKRSYYKTVICFITFTKQKRPLLTRLKTFIS